MPEFSDIFFAIIMTMIVTFDQLPAIRKKHKGQRIVYTGGVYDLVHRGHIESLVFRKSLGDILVCGVVSDERAQFRKRLPIHSEQDRIAVIDALRDVDYAIIAPLPMPEKSSALRIIDALRPDVYAEHIEHANRWSDEDRVYAKRLGVALIFDTQAKIRSTTNIISELKLRAGI